MARPERPIDPDDGPLARFAFDLRALRRAGGGVSYRELAKRANFSRTALSQAASGTELPSLAVTLAYVEACGGDVAAWEERWRVLATELNPAPAPAPAPAVLPSRGASQPGQRPPGAEVRSGRRRLLWLAAPLAVSVGLVAMWQMAGSASHTTKSRATGAAGSAPATKTTPATPAKPRPLVTGDDDKFVADVTIPDGTVIKVNPRFTKTWEIQNTGSVPWRGRWLQRQGLSQGTGLCTSTDQVRVPDTLPGQHVQISVVLRAPKPPGPARSTGR